MKSLKEYITGFSNGTSNLAPIASLGDTPPKGAQYRTKRMAGITASKNVKGTALHTHLVKKGVIKNKE
jgi:hypothetical protein|tara:strand:+ start:904 stop:1107 length:204 start_codon:yes stop_codon:yes gene_type:complete